jgi:putative membrane protein
MTESPISQFEQNTETVEHKLHGWSWAFTASHQLKKVALPLLAFVFLQNNPSKFIIFSVLGALAAVIWGVLQARSFRYSVMDGELLVRAGVWNKTIKHIPSTRIQSITQRRGVFHRLLNVTELRIDSASEGKHEAMMKVLSLAAAANLEELLRGAVFQPNSIKSNADQFTSADAASRREILHSLDFGELVRHGLISNQSIVVLAAAFGVLSKHTEHIKKFSFLRDLTAPLRDLALKDFALQHLLLMFFLSLLSLMVLMLCLRIFSIGFAIVKYYGFKLEMEGEGLHAEYGLVNKVRCGVRLPRLQRLVLVRSWLHRRFDRCRLAVDVVGGVAKDKSGAEAKLRELAPIATPGQADALLSVCLSNFDLAKLSWQPLHPAAAMRRFRQLMLWTFPVVLLLIGVGVLMKWPLPKAVLFLCIPLLCFSLWRYAIAWARFTAYAEHANCLVYRTGVLTQRWVIVMPTRLQSVSLLESSLDRRTGVRRLRADTQGGSCKGYALDIPYLSLAEAQRLRELIWGKITQTNQE